MESKTANREAMFLKIEQWKQSGQAQKNFCDQECIPYHIFHYWYKRYRDQNNKSKDKSSSFVQLEVKDGRHQPLMELLLSNGSRLIFYQAVSSDYLKSVIG